MSEYKVTYERDDGHEAEVTLEADTAHDALEAFTEDTGYPEESVVRVEKQ